MRWDNDENRPGVFVCRDDGRTLARVVQESEHWEWASYKGGWTHDCGKEPNFGAACVAAEKSIQATR